MGATDWTELPGSPTEDFDATSGKYTATRMIQCDWADRYLVANSLLWGLGTKEYEYAAGLFATKCVIAPIGTAGFEAESALNHKSLYTKAQLTIQYESQEAYEGNPADAGNYTGADLISQTTSLEVQMLSVTSGKLYWDSDCTKLIQDGQVPSKRVPTKKHQITFHNITKLPAEFDSLAGTVNVAAYTIVTDKTRSVTPTKVGNYLYEGYSMDRTITEFGTAGWNLVISISECLNQHADNWNAFWNPDTHTWGPLYYAPGGSDHKAAIYTIADWTKLGLPPIYEPTP